MNSINIIEILKYTSTDQVALSDIAKILPDERYSFKDYVRLLVDNNGITDFLDKCDDDKLYTNDIFSSHFQKVHVSTDSLPDSISQNNILKIDNINNDSKNNIDIKFLYYSNNEALLLQDINSYDHLLEKNNVESVEFSNNLCTTIEENIILVDKQEHYTYQNYNFSFTYDDISYHDVDFHFDSSNDFQHEYSNDILRYSQNSLSNTQKQNINNIKPKETNFAIKYDEIIEHDEIIMSDYESNIKENFDIDDTNIKSIQEDLFEKYNILIENTSNNKVTSEYENESNIIKGSMLNIEHHAKRPNIPNNKIILEYENKLDMIANNIIDKDYYFDNLKYRYNNFTLRENTISTEVIDFIKNDYDINNTYDSCKYDVSITDSANYSHNYTNFAEIYSLSDDFFNSGSGSKNSLQSSEITNMLSNRKFFGKGRDNIVEFKLPIIDIPEIEQLHIKFDNNKVYILLKNNSNCVQSSSVTFSIMNAIKGDLKKLGFDDVSIESLDDRDNSLNVKHIRTYSKVGYKCDYFINMVV